MYLFALKVSVIAVLIPLCVICICSLHIFSLSHHDSGLYTLTMCTYETSPLLIRLNYMGDWCQYCDTKSSKIVGVNFCRSVSECKQNNQKTLWAQNKGWYMVM